jgi:hypothetical protein
LVKFQNALPGSTLHFVDALIKANKDFDLIYLPSRNRVFGYNDYTRRRICDFFVRHLLGATPPDWNAEADAGQVKPILSKVGQGTIIR